MALWNPLRSLEINRHKPLEHYASAHTPAQTSYHKTTNKQNPLQNQQKKILSICKNSGARSWSRQPKTARQVSNPAMGEIDGFHSKRPTKKWDEEEEGEEGISDPEVEGMEKKEEEEERKLRRTREWCI